MKVIYLQTVTMMEDMLWAFKEADFEIDIFPDYKFSPMADNKEGQELLDAYLKEHKADIVYSYFFIPQVSDVCEANEIHYLSWTYDSICLQFYFPAIMNKYNITLPFDRAEAEGLKLLGAPNVYYMPLAANLTRIGQLVINKADEKRFATDVSFIGNLYEKNNYNEAAPHLDSNALTELNQYLIKNTCKWDKTKDWPLVSEELVNTYKKIFNAGDWNTSEMPDELFLGVLVLTRKLAEIDRITVLNELAERYKVDLYTGSESENLSKKLRIHKTVDYYNEMSKIFYLSKINLNITLPSIRTGVPQRIFDVMGCGGFMMSNHQEELEDMFTIGKEIETFKSLEECIDKTKYYLSHEKERKKVAINGYKAIKERHTFNHRMKEIINIIKEVKGEA